MQPLPLVVALVVWARCRNPEAHIDTFISHMSNIKLDVIVYLTYILPNTLQYNTWKNILIICFIIGDYVLAVEYVFPSDNLWK